MDTDLLRRVRRSALIFGGVLMVPLATYFGVRAGIGWGAGIVWSLVNLHFIASVVTNVLTDDRRVPKIVVVLLVKFPVLYAVGFLLMKIGLPALWLVAGFTWPYFVVVLKGAGRAYMGLDETSADTAR